MSSSPCQCSSIPLELELLTSPALPALSPVRCSEEINDLTGTAFHTPNPSIYTEPISFPSNPSTFQSFSSHALLLVQTEQLLKIGTDKIDSLLLAKHFGVVGVNPSSIIPRVSSLPFFLNT